MNRAIIYLLIAFISAKNSPGQTLPLNQFSSNNGLPSSVVYSVFQDSKFRYWVCTDNGVSLFNGSSFTNFTMDNGLPTNTIFSCFENKNDGKLWFITYGFGLCCYDETSGKFIQPKFNKNLIKIFNKKFINSCVFDQNNDLWITYHYHDYLKIDPGGNITKYPARFEFKGGGFEIVREADVLFVRNIFGIKQRENIPFTAQWNKNKTVIKGNITSNLTDAKISRISDSIMVLAYEDALLFISKSNKITVKKLASNVLSLIKDKQNNIWIGTVNKGIFIIDHSDPDQEPKNIMPLQDMPISSIMEDFNGKIWFSTLTNGIYCITNTGITNYLLNKKVFKIFDDGIQLSFLTRGGDIYKTGYKKFDFSVSVDPGEIKDIKQGPDNIVYVCKAVYNKFMPKKLDHKNIAANSIEFFENYFYVGGKNFLIKYNYDHLLEKYYALPSPLFSICKLNSSKLLIGCLNGLFVFQNEKFIAANGPGWLKNTRINSIAVHNNKIFVLTDGKGLLIYEGNDLSKYVLNEGPLINSINCLAFENDHHIWLGTNAGLLKTSIVKNGQLEILSKLTINDGLPSNEINDIKILSGQIMVATNAGLSLFKSDIKQIHQLYPTYISFILGNFKDTLFNGYSRYVNLHIDKKWRNLYIKFSGNKDQSNAFLGKVSFSLLKDNKVINDWTTILDNNVQFTNLEPGNYKFLVKATDEIKQNNFISEANFIIAPFYYEKGWVKILFFITLLFLMVIGVWVLIKKMNSDNELKRNMIKAEINSLRNQMNPHFIFNALNSIQYFIFENSQEKAAKFLSKFSTLIRKSLEFSKLNFISVREEINYIKEYIEIEKMRFNDKFNYEIDIDSNIDLEKYFIPPLLMQPLIESSIKHGFSDKNSGGMIAIKLWIEEQDILSYSIVDNGKGFIPEAVSRSGYKTSMSHNILRERFSLLKNDFGNNKLIGMTIINNVFDNTYGTQIVLKLPLKYD